MRQLKLTIAFCLTFCLSLDAQVDKVKELVYESGFTFKPLLYASGGISFPVGKYAVLAQESGKAGAAGLGGYVELALTHRLRRTPLWGVQLVMGYMQHQFRVEAIKQKYQPDLFDGEPWRVFYAMPGIEFQGGVRFRFALMLSAGMLVYSGWNAKRGDYSKGMIALNEWEFKRRLAASVRAGLCLGYRPNKRLFIYTQATWLYGGAGRTGEFSQAFYRYDPATGVLQQPAISDQKRTVLHQTVIHTINIGVGLRYQFYKYLFDPNSKFDRTIRVW